MQAVVIPVYQESFGFGNGSCAWACVASIFELTHAELGIEKIMPPCDEDLKKYTECRFPDFVCNVDDRGYDYELVDGPSVPKHPHPKRWHFKVPDYFEPPPVEYWMATVFSPGLKRPEHDPYYPMPALHAVVMRGSQLAHDPNPKYNHDSLYSPVVVRTWWTPNTTRPKVGEPQYESLAR